MRTTLLTVALTVSLAAPAVARQLKIDFHDGLVTVEATAVPIRTILAEWERIGGTKVVGAERISGAPLTLKLVDVSEARALETILRSVAGYMAAPRQADNAGPSMYDRILVMATSSAPAPPAAARPAPGNNNAINSPQQFMPPRPPQLDEADDQEPDEEPDQNPPNAPVFTFPQPGAPANQPGQFIGNGVNQPGQNVPNQNQGNITIAPSTPGRPIGVSTPGMMVNPPQPQPPQNQPGSMIRPPGGGRQ